MDCTTLVVLASVLGGFQEGEIIAVSSAKVDRLAKLDCGESAVRRLYRVGAKIPP